MIRASVCLLSLLAASVAQAALTVTFDRDAFFSSVPWAIRDEVTFDGGPAVGQSVDGRSFSSIATFGLCGKPGPDCINSRRVRWRASGLDYAVVATAFSEIGAAVLPEELNSTTYFTRAIGVEVSGNTQDAVLSVYNYVTKYSASFDLNGYTGFVGIRSDYGFDYFGLTKYSFSASYEMPFTLENVYIFSAVPEPPVAVLLALGAFLISFLRRPPVVRSTT